MPNPQIKDGERVVIIEMLKRVKQNCRPNDLHCRLPLQSLEALGGLVVIKFGI